MSNGEVEEVESGESVEIRGRPRIMRQAAD
jgi:hypothetical protein